MATKRAEFGKPGHSREAYTIPGVHGRHIAQLVSRWGVSAEELLGPLGLTLEELSASSARLPIPLVERLVARARALTGEPGLGYYLGLQMRVSAHGYLGFAAMTSSTIREALDLATRFAPTRSTAIDLRLDEHGDEAHVVFDETCSFGSARDVVIIALTVGLWRIGESLTGRQLMLAAEFAFTEPAYVARLATQLPGSFSFSQPANRLIIDRKVLDLPLTMADPDALQLAREQCERELDRLGYQQSFIVRVRSALGGHDRELPSIEQMASELGTSGRTLKRKLAEEGKSYSELVDEVQATRARALLKSQLTIEEIASRLGYSDAANFRRAFRRWTGKSPGAHRKA